MSTQEDPRNILIRGVVTMRAVKIALDHTEPATPQYRRLLFTLMTLEDQVDLALDAISDLIVDPIANDD